MTADECATQVAQMRVKLFRSFAALKDDDGGFVAIKPVR
jgi:hypothetical protein